MEDRVYVRLCQILAVASGYGTWVWIVRNTLGLSGRAVGLMTIATILVLVFRSAPPAHEAARL